MIAYPRPTDMPATSPPPSETGLRPPEVNADPNIGRTLGERYRILRRLGEGGMGTVYLCEHVLLRRRVAVKVLRDELARDPEIAERFRNEAVAASQIGGDHVVDVIDFGRTEDGAFFYVMEALEGRSLGAVLREEGPLPVARALGLVAQVCRALSAAHARGVVHRDLKPENVFVVVDDDGAERAKVLDFGISHIDPLGAGARLTRAGAIIGTPEYMSPEQASGAVVDHRADVYALGVLLYEVLTGALPIEGGTPLATLVAHQSQVPNPPSARRAEIPLDVDALVLCALAKRPDDRFESMDAFAAALNRARARLGPESPAGTAGGVSRGTAVLDAPPRPSTRRRNVKGHTVALPAAPSAVAAAPAGRLRWLVVVASICGLVAVAAFGGWWWRGRPSPTPTAKPSATANSTGTPFSTQNPPEVQPQIQTDPAIATVRAPELIPAPSPARSAPARPRRAAPAPREAADPYAESAELKPDPFE
jgi:serine/threonine protein kinase